MMLTSTHGAAIVTGRRDEYLGVVNFTAVTGHIQATEQQLAESRAAEDTAGRDDAWEGGGA